MIRMEQLYPDLQKVSRFVRKVKGGPKAPSHDYS